MTPFSASMSSLSFWLSHLKSIDLESGRGQTGRLLLVVGPWQRLEMRARYNRHRVHVSPPLSSATQQPELRQPLQEAFFDCTHPVDSPLPHSTITVCLHSAFLVSLPGMVLWPFHMCLSGPSNRFLTPKIQKICLMLTSLFSSRELINILYEYYIVA